MSNDSRLKYLVKNSFLFALGNIGTKIISFFLVPIYTNVLIASEYGTVDLVITLATFIVPVLIFNINEAVMRFSLDEDSDQNAIMSVGILFILIMILITTAGIPLIKIYKPISDYYLYVYFYIISSGCCTVLLYNLRGKELLLQFSIGSIINAVCIAIFNILFLLVLKKGLAGFLMAYIFANFVTAIYAGIVGNVKKTIYNFKIEKILTIRMIKYSIVLIPNSFMWWIMNSSDRVMLTAMVGITSTGIYAISSKLPSIVSLISSIFNQAWNYSAIREDNSEDRENYNNMVYTYLVAFVVMTGISMMLLLKPIMRLYVAPSYYEAWLYTPPLIVGTCILVLATFLASQYTVKKDSMGYLLSGCIGTIVNVILNFALIPMYGALGAGIATCMSYTVVFIYRCIDIKKYLSLKTLSLKHAIAFSLLIFSSFSVYLVDPICYFVIAIALLTEIILYKDSWVYLLRKLISKRKDYKIK